ncbi:MAG: hypothetical protein LUQ09_02955 [Methanomassiliicoccales archaeon]|nr:hypothetical protein [Methanomassiliicoccales archaeon]
MESDKLDRGKLVDEFVKEIMDREGNRGKQCVALDLMRKHLIDPPEGMIINDEEFSWLIGVLRRRYADFIIPEKCKICVKRVKAMSSVLSRT